MSDAPLSLDAAAVLAAVNAALTHAGSEWLVGLKDGAIAVCTITEFLDGLGVPRIATSAPHVASAADARDAHALFTTMTTTQLRHLRAAHVEDLQRATTPESIAFGAGRIALIDAVLTARGPRDDVIDPRD